MSSSCNYLAGTIRLVQDIGKLLNNRQGSDVQFKFGDGHIDPNIDSTGETTTLYAHSAILRCRSRHFADMFDGDKERNKRSDRVIHKSNVSPYVFHKALEYIYTGEVQVKTDDLLELLSAANEMELEELSIECQANIIVALKHSFSNKEENIGNKPESSDKKTHNPKQHLPISIAVHKLFIPALTLAQSHTMVNFFQELLTLAIKHLRIIFASLDTSTAFFERIPISIFQQIFASDALEIQEYDVWELAFSMACYKAKVPKSAAETHFKLECSAYYDEMEFQEGDSSESQSLLSGEQVKQLNVNLKPLLPVIRFTLMKGDQYSRIVEILSFFLPTRRSIELRKFFTQSEKMQLLDSPRLNRQQESGFNTEKSNPFSSIIDKIEFWQQIKTWTFESNKIKNCRSPRDVKLDLLFRASEHEFAAAAFHKHCDNKGPTIVIVKSHDGYLFGGVNFAHWESPLPFGSSSGTTSNFLFALADGRHRKAASKFLYLSKDGGLSASINHLSYGPRFGFNPSDLTIHDKANTLLSYSGMPSNYHGDEASNTALAGKDYFLVAEYEVFSILNGCSNPIPDLSLPTRPESIRFEDLHQKKEPTLYSGILEKDPNPLSNIIDKMELWQQMKKWIIESNEIKDYRSVGDVELNLLFRASEHEFAASAFHKHCDNKGPTIVIVKSHDGHLFGGVNFAHWESPIPFGSYSGTTSDFLFALVDGRHRITTEKFLYQDKDGKLKASFNISYWGPTFGPYPHDLFICDKANKKLSCSYMPKSYRGAGASNTALAGKNQFLIKEYEVFSISKSCTNTIPDLFLPIGPEKIQLGDLPRKKKPSFHTEVLGKDPNPLSNIIDKMELWQQMKEWIIESNEIKDCRSVGDVELNLLFRASEHKFTASAFHKHCDNKGPTIVIVKSDDGGLFGGVNFAHWESNGTYSGTTSDFLFVLVDGRHRITTEKFLYQDKDGKLKASFNISYWGPTFGPYPHDLFICDKANKKLSCSYMPQSYHGAGASNTALAGKNQFLIKEYEVFSISKSCTNTIPDLSLPIRPEKIQLGDLPRKKKPSFHTEVLGKDSNSSSNIIEKVES